MACINPDGSLTGTSRAVLGRLAEGTDPWETEGLRAATGLPLFRLRASLRELGEAGLVAHSPAGWQITDLGREALELDAAG